MLRFTGKQVVLKDNWKEGFGWLPVSIRSKDLVRLIGQDVQAIVLIDEDLSHNPKELVDMKVTKESEGLYQVNEHKLIFKPRYTCDCDYYRYSKGNAPCKHLLAIMRKIVAEKKF